MIFKYQDREFRFERYPETTNKSLQAWSAADEYILLKLQEFDLHSKAVAICNDRFGFLSTTLHHLNPFVVINRKSQQKSIEHNLARNNEKWDESRWTGPLDSLPKKVDIGIIHIPKTLDLFRLYLGQIHEALAENGVVLCSFMTKYFSPQMLSIAGDFFEETDQSLAKKKSRVLILKGKKDKVADSGFEEIPFSFIDDHQEHIKQYPGVFSGGHIDYATQFLIEHLHVSENDAKVLDMGAGNGVIARAVQLKNPSAELHMLDDSRLAIESSKLNLASGNTYFHWSDTLTNLEKGSFDMVVSNPPFHFGHETNIEVSIRLFAEVVDILKPSGRFICVANQHLNYKTHLEKLFTTVEVVAQNDKFIVYKSLR